MIIALLVLVPICFVMFWFFFKSSPKIQNKRKTILRFNLATVLAAILSCVWLTYSTHHSMIDTVDRAWWPVLSGLGSLIFFPVVLLVGALIRMIVFRKDCSNIS